ncbi:hypothetical protein D3C75_388530 [compost metagenome]
MRQGHVVQDGATNIAISDHPQQMMLLIHDQTDPQRLRIDHGQSIAHRVFGRQHHFFPILAHSIHPLLLDRHHAAPGNVCNLLFSKRVSKRGSRPHYGTGANRYTLDHGGSRADMDSLTRHHPTG